MSYEGGGGGGRLCGAVQRVMAMRTRKLHICEGIGAMRHHFSASPVNEPETGCCWRCGRKIEPGLEYWEGAGAGIESLGSMTTGYRRFCQAQPQPVNIERHEMCKSCWDSHAAPAESVRRKGLFARLVCRHFLRLHNKFSPAPAL